MVITDQILLSFVCLPQPFTVNQEGNMKQPKAYPLFTVYGIKNNISFWCEHCGICTLGVHCWSNITLALEHSVSNSGFQISILYIILMVDRGASLNESKLNPISWENSLRNHHLAHLEVWLQSPVQN